MTEDRPDCPGHKKKCKFCKEEKGRYRYLARMKQIDRVTKKPLIDHCCHQCKSNDEHAREKFPIDIAARFGTKVPRGDQV